MVHGWYTPSARSRGQRGVAITEPADATARELAVALRIDKRLPTPVYLQLRDALDALIAAGGWPAGRALPSERDLALALGLSRMTIRRSFDELQRDGLLERRHGSGTYVRARRVEQTIDRLIGFTDEARALGVAPGARLLEFGVVPADPEVASALTLADATPVLRISRLRTADGEPLAIQDAYLRPTLVTLERSDVDDGASLYRALERRFGVVAQRARQTIAARLPQRRERLLLGIPADQPILALLRTTFDPDDHPFEFVRSAYRGDRYQVALDLKAEGA
jgi:GntR family transcriptional regulator